MHPHLCLKKYNAPQQKIVNVPIFCEIWHLLQWFNQSAIILLTKINELPLSRLAPECSLLSPCPGCGRPAQRLLLNIPPKTLALR